MVHLWDTNDVSGAWLVGNIQGYRAATGTPICEVTAPPSPDGSGATGGSLSASQSGRGPSLERRDGILATLFTPRQPTLKG
jgi:hypothetical protein